MEGATAGVLVTVLCVASPLVSCVLGGSGVLRGGSGAGMEVGVVGLARREAPLPNVFERVAITERLLLWPFCRLAFFAVGEIGDGDEADETSREGLSAGNEVTSLARS